MERYKIEYIPLKNLCVVWVSAQRPYDEKWAKSIADDFDPDKFDPIVVTLPNGNGIYHIIEGQHRRNALQMYAGKVDNTSGENELAPCRVVDEADPARAAEIFLGINSGRKAIKPVAEFKVAVTAEREAETQINKVLHRLGYQVSSAKSPFNVSAVSALKMIYNRHGIATVERTVRTLNLLWNGDPTAVSSPLLRGFAIFANEFYSHVNMRRLQSQIGVRFTPFKFTEAAKARKQNTMEKLDEAISELLIREYNRGLKDGARLHHKSI
jgi:uncharacterized protein DUF6551